MESYEKIKEYLPTYKVVILLIFVAMIVLAVVIIMFIYDPYIPVRYWNPIIRPFLRKPDQSEVDKYLNYLYSQRDIIIEELVKSKGSKVIDVADINSYEKGLNDKGTWKMIYLRILNNLTNEKEFPRTHRLLRQAPFRIGTATFSCLYPNTDIPKHQGPYEGVYRCHIPLIIPEGDLGITIYGEKDVTYDWSRPFSFEDTDYHKAWNHTSNNRIVLIFDIVKDLPFPLNIVNNIFLSLSSYHASYLS